MPNHSTLHICLYGDEMVLEQLLLQTRRYSVAGSQLRVSPRSCYGSARTSASSMTGASLHYSMQVDQAQEGTQTLPLTMPCPPWTWSSLPPSPPHSTYSLYCSAHPTHSIPALPPCNPHAGLCAPAGFHWQASVSFTLAGPLHLRWKLLYNRYKLASAWCNARRRG